MTKIHMEVQGVRVLRRKGYGRGKQFLYQLSSRLSRTKNSVFEDKLSDVLINKQFGCRDKIYATLVIYEVECRLSQALHTYVSTLLSFHRNQPS
jgi:hypothetical protein